MLLVAPACWHIDALDVSENHLSTARAARYGELSFRQTEPQLRERYFRPVGRLWEINTGRELSQFTGHTAPIWSVAFSPDGRRALSGSGRVETKDGKRWFATPRFFPRSMIWFGNPLTANSKMKRSSFMCLR